MKKIRITLCSLVLALASVHLNAAPLGAAFTYQGRLTDGANPANGTIPMVFGLWDSDASGINVGTPASFPTNVPVANGLFTVDLDFGAAAFSGDARWLEIRVNGTLLTTRQRVAPTPNALYASMAGTANGVAANGVSGISLQTGSLHFNGSTYLHENTLYFGTDASHGVGYRSTYAGVAGIDGPVLFGYGGGGLGSTVPDVLALSWNRQGNVGIGTANPLSKLQVGQVGNSGVGVFAGDRAPFGAALFQTDVNTPGTHAWFAENGERVFSIEAGGIGNFKGTVTASSDLNVGGSTTMAGACYARGNVEVGNGAFAESGLNEFIVQGVLDFNGGGTQTRLIVKQNGNVGIGSSNPQAKLHVSGNVHYTGQLTKLDVADNFTAVVRCADFKIGGSSAPDRRSTPGRALVDLGSELHVNFANDWGRTVIGGSSTSVKVLEITGGADLAEPFPMKEEEIAKGSVVVIDEDHSGQLKLSTRAYDTQVAGIISGANGVNPGIALQQQGVLEGGQNVALTGRVYVQADASFGAIKPGDLLTTSDTPGHAMKVLDNDRAHGAILGKAMSALKEGKGMVLVLVTLQ